MNKTVLITGASTGIGKELSYIFARNGYDLILVARNSDQLKKIKEEIEESYHRRVFIIARDISESAAPEFVFNKVSKEFKMPLDVLVNNAGFGLYRRFEETDINRELNMIDLNIKALTHLTKLFLPEMLERGGGKIMNVASVAGFMPGPLMSVYYATKAYVVSFTLALHQELHKKGIAVSALCPGPTKTEFTQRAQLEHLKFFKGNSFFIHDAKSVAIIGFNGLMNGKPVIIPGLLNKLTVQMLRFLPGTLVRGLTRRVMEKR